MPQFTFDAHSAFVSPNKPIDDGEAETRAADRLGASWISAVEALEDVLFVLRRDADAGILHAQVDMALAGGDGDDDAALRVGVVERIVNEAHDDLDQASGVTNDGS